MSLCCEYPAAPSTIRRRTHRGNVLNKFRQPQASPLVLAPKQEPDVDGVEKEEGFSIPDALAALGDYERNIYPVFPIITPSQVREIAASAETDRNARALLISIYAVTIGNSRGPAATPHVTRLVHLAFKNRGVIGPDYKITLHSVMTSVLISCCLMATHNSDISWIYLREAMTMASIMRLDDVATYCELPVSERSKRQRLYWLLYVHERFMAIHSYRPVLLSPLSVLPEQDPSIPQRVYDGFLQIIKLFRLVDSNFMEVYLSKDSSNVVINQKWFEEKETQIAESESGIESLSEMQQVDLIITQQWLRMLVWKMAMSRFWLSTGISEGCMSLLLPVQIARRLRTLISKCSEESIRVHGTSILRKLFELSIAIGNVIILVPAKSIKESAERVEDYMWIANFLLRQPEFNDDQKSQLNEKLQRVYSVFPDIPRDGAQSRDDAPQDDPWLSLSRPFVAETTYENSLPLMPTLDNLSEMSQGLLNELNISV